MKCALCGKTSIDARIRQFPLSPEARAMLRRQFDIIDEAFVQTAVCRECMALPLAERNKLAQEAIKIETDEHRRELLEDTSTNVGIESGHSLSALMLLLVVDRLHRFPAAVRDFPGDAVVCQWHLS